MMTLRQRARLAALRALAPALVRNPSTSGNLRRILAIRPDHLGDLLLSVPALRHLKQATPDCHLGLLIGPWNTEAAAGIPYVDEVIELPFPWFDRAPLSGPLAPYRLLEEEAARIGAMGWDTSVVLRHDFWWGALLAARAGIPRRVGYGTLEAAPYLTDSSHLPRLGHETEQAMRLACAVTGVNETPGPLEFRASTTDQNAAAGWRKERGLRPGYLVVHPGAGAPVKAWGGHRFAAVVSRLGSDKQIVVTGGPGEEALVESVAGGHQVERLIGAPLGVVAEVLRHAALALGVDSGIMHLAAAVGTPTVRLYGPVDSERFGPWGDPVSQVVVRAAPPCVPCNRLDFAPQELPMHPCMRAIPEAAVLSASLSLWERVRERAPQPCV